MSDVVLTPLTAQIDVGGSWHVTLFILMSVIVLNLVWAQNLPVTAKTLWAYVLIYSLGIFEFPAIWFGTYNTAFQVTAGQTFAECSVITLGALYLSRAIWKLFPALMTWEILCVWMGWPGLMNAHSFSIAYMALYLPFAPLWLAVPVILTIITHHGTTALVILGAQALAVAVKNSHRWNRWCIAALICTGFTSLYILASIHSSGPWLDGGTRLAKYQTYMEVWAQGWQTIVIGTGPGSFMWFSLLIDKFQGELWFCMHSDWLQILFELGAVGLALSVAVWVDAVRTAWQAPRLVSAIFGCSAMALSYHGLRYGPTAVLTALIFKEAFSYKRSSPATRP